MDIIGLKEREGKKPIDRMASAHFRLDLSDVGLSHFAAPWPP
jgi:hypothetical protein